MRKTYFVRITNGKFTLPKELRDKYGLLPGSEVKVYVKKGLINIEPVKK